MKGVCNLAGEDPAQVRPCLWSYQTMPDVPESQKEYVYSILF